MKRGFLFTFLALLLVLLFYVIIQTRLVLENRDTTTLVQQRVEDINKLVLDIEQKIFPNIMTATGRSGLATLWQHVNETTFFENKTAFERGFRDCIFNGTVNATYRIEMENQTIPYILESVENLSEDVYHVNVTVKVHNETINITQDTPFAVRVNATFEYSIRSKEAFWHPKNHSVSVNFTVKGLNDPYYSVYTDGNYTQVINATNVTEGDWSIKRLLGMIRARHYGPNKDAPSYLQRFYNDTSASDIGIESFINPLAINRTLHGTYFEDAHNRSYVDWLFWDSPWNCSDYVDNFNEQHYDLHNISGINVTGFRLEDAHLTMYLNTSRDEHRDRAVGGNTTTVCANPP
mgnify:CR=1 FL=1